MKLLIQGAAILAQDVVDAGDEIHSADAIYPKHVLDGWQIVDVDVPAGFTPAGYTWDGTQLVAKSKPAPTQDEKDALMKQVDTDADAIIFAVIGNREKEYNDAYADAVAFINSMYALPAPQTVQDWAEIKKASLEWAAHNVKATGDAWIVASALIRKNRLARKEDARNATTAEQLATAAQAWEIFKSQIRSQLGA